MGCLICIQGDSGVIKANKEYFERHLRCEFETIKMLPNIHIEEGLNDNGAFAVTFKNWFKYQVDSTGYERVKKFRNKQNDNGTRGEENKRRIRREKEAEEEQKEPVDNSKPDNGKDALPTTQKEPEQLTDKEKHELGVLMARIQDHYKASFNSGLWIQNNHRLNWKTHVLVMQRIAEYLPEAPKAYADKVASIEEGNFNERDHVKKSQAQKADFMGIVNDLKKMRGRN